MTPIESTIDKKVQLKLIGMAILAIFFGAGIASAVIYFTPALRYSPIVAPVVIDIDPVTFQEMRMENPEKFVFLDVRQATTYAKEHAEGAESLPLQKLYTEKENLPREGKTIVLICSGGSASGVGYSYLEHYGFTNILRVAGGIESWKAAGLPMRTKEPEAL